MSRLNLFSFFNGSNFSSLFYDNSCVVGKGVDNFSSGFLSYNCNGVSSNFCFSSSFFVTASEERHAEYYSKHKN